MLPRCVQMKLWGGFVENLPAYQQRNNLILFRIHQYITNFMKDMNYRFATVLLVRIVTSQHKNIKCYQFKYEKKNTFTQTVNTVADCKKKKIK